MTRLTYSDAVMRELAPTVVMRVIADDETILERVMSVGMARMKIRSLVEAGRSVTAEIRDDVDEVVAKYDGDMWMTRVTLESGESGWIERLI